MKKVKVQVCKFDTKKLHPYDVKTTGKHPVHMIEGGAYLTLDERDFDDGHCSDMGWFFLNIKEYNYMMEHMEEVELEVNE